MKPSGLCVHNVEVETSLLIMSTVLEASHAMAGSFCAQDKNKKNAEFWKQKPQAGKHSLHPKAREMLKSLPCSKFSKVCVFCRDKGQVCALPARGSAHTTTRHRFLTSPMGTHTLSTLGREHCPHPTGRLLVWRQPALGTE